MFKFLPALVVALALIFTAPAPCPADVILDLTRSIVKVQTLAPDDKMMSCSGFVVNAAKGWVVTAAHCIVEGYQGVRVDGIDTEVVKKNDVLAIVAMEPMTKPPVELRNPKIGENTRSVGFALNEYLSILWRHVANIKDQDFLLDGPFIPGMSGGPIFGDDGKVVGLVQGSTQVFGVACGGEEIKDFIKSVK